MGTIGHEPTLAQLNKRPHGPVRRRTVLRGGAAVGAALVASGAMNPAHAGGPQPDAKKAAPGQAFQHGVASGDPMPQTVVLWTRVTPAPAAVPGSGIGPDTRLTWEVAADPRFHSVVRSGQVTARASEDHTVHVDPFGLEPATDYWYRFTVAEGPLAGSVSPTGRTRTAPAAESDVDTLRFALTSCANWESGYFGAYADIAAHANRGEIDCVLHVGDYIYEFASGNYTGKFGVVRPHEPAWETVTLKDYRTRYGRYRRDACLQDAHAAVPWVVTWDDHEIANNCWSGGARNHNPERGEGEYLPRRDAAMRAYFEWLPVRASNPSEGGHLYRNLRFGKLAEVSMLDLRTYRSKPEKMRRDVMASPDRTIMGGEQFQWLADTLTTADARWNLIGNSVMITPVNLADIDRAVAPPLARLLGWDGGELPLNTDQWDGFAADRDRLLRLLASRGPEGQSRTVFLTGDIHSEWATILAHEGRTVAAELVCTSVSSPNVDDALQLPEDSPTSLAGEAHLKSHNTGISHVDLDAHGYTLVTVTPDSVEGQWLRVDDVTVSGSPLHSGPRATFDGATLRMG